MSYKVEVTRSNSDPKTIHQSNTSMRLVEMTQKGLRLLHSGIGQLPTEGL